MRSGGLRSDSTRWAPRGLHGRGTVGMKYSALGKILGGDQIGECPERKTATGRPPRGSVVPTGPPVRWYSQRHQREGEAHARGPGGIRSGVYGFDCCRQWPMPDGNPLGHEGATTAALGSRRRQGGLEPREGQNVGLPQGHDRAIPRPPGGAARGGGGTHGALGPAPALETDAVGVACGQGVGEGGEGSWMGSGVQQTGRNSQLAGGGRSEIRGRRSEQSSKT